MAKTGAREDKVESYDGYYTIYVKDRPVKGAANKKIIMLLSKHLKLPRECMSIKVGAKSNKKIVDIALPVV